MRSLTIPTSQGDIRCEQFGEPIRQAVLWSAAQAGIRRARGRCVHPPGRAICKPGRVVVVRPLPPPGRLDDCVADVRAGVGHLAANGAQEVLLVGHSFGGAVVIQAAIACGAPVVGVAALSSQSFGTFGVEQLSPRPLLLIHGETDEILPPRCSHDIFHRANDPKELILYPGCMHGLDQCAAALDRDLTAWIENVLQIAHGRAGS
jgi:pimeloyl-ACP methyl ester carboxylesterase